MLMVACAACVARAQPSRTPDKLASEQVRASSNTLFPFKQIGPGLFVLGEVRLNKTQRTVSFPVTVNQREGMVEYAVVTATGKTHESLFRTEAQPDHVHISLLLLGAKPANTDRFPTNSPIPGQRVLIEVGWNQQGQELHRPLEDFIVTTNNHQSLTHGPWIYNGSYVLEGRFMAGDDGSILSVHTDPAALINNPRECRENDDLNHVNTGIMPPGDGPLQITIQLPTNSVPERPGDPPASATDILPKPKPRSASAP
jgi:hypothetical protein